MNFFVGIMIVFVITFCWSFSSAQDVSQDEQMMGGGFSHFFQGDMNTYDESIEKLSDETKKIVLSQLIDLLVVPENLFLHRVKSELKLSHDNINGYKEGFYGGWAFTITNFNEDNFSFDAEKNMCPGFTGLNRIEISLSEAGYMQKSLSSSKESFHGFVDGRDFATVFIEKAFLIIHEKAVDFKRENNRNVSSNEKVEILNSTPEYEALTFLKEVIRPKEKLWKNTDDKECGSPTDVREAENVVPKAETGEKQGDIPVKNQDEKENESK